MSLALQPIATARFADAPFTEGWPNGFLSSHIWTDTFRDFLDGELRRCRARDPPIEFTVQRDPAERTLALFAGEWRGDIDRVFRDFAF